MFRQRRGREEKQRKSTQQMLPVSLDIFLTIQFPEFGLEFII